MVKKQESLSGIKTILLISFLISLIYFGISTLFFPKITFEIFGVPKPPFFVWVRAFGVLSIGMAVALWFAYKDPLKNTAVIFMTIVTYVLLAVLFSLAIFAKHLPTLAWLDVGLLTIISILLIYFYARI